MSNKKQTAVDWLESEMLKPNLSMKDIFNQAKAMQVKANADYFSRGFKQGLKTAIQRIEDEQ